MIVPSDGSGGNRLAHQPGGTNEQPLDVAHCREAARSHRRVRRGAGVRGRRGRGGRRAHVRRIRRHVDRTGRACQRGHHHARGQRVRRPVRRDAAGLPVLLRSRHGASDLGRGAPDGLHVPDDHSPRAADAAPADVAVSDWMDLVVIDRFSTGDRLPALPGDFAHIRPGETWAYDVRLTTELSPGRGRTMRFAESPTGRGWTVTFAELGRERRAAGRRRGPHLLGDWGPAASGRRPHGGAGQPTGADCFGGSSRRPWLYSARVPDTEPARPSPTRAEPAGRDDAGARRPRDRGRGPRRPGAHRPGGHGRGGRPPPSPVGSTCSSRPAPAPASRWPTSSPPCSTTPGWSSRPRRWRSSTSSSSATSRAWSRRSGRCPASTRRTPCSRAAPTTPACTASARACPTTRACWSRCRPGRRAPRCSSCARGPRRRPRSGGTRRARQRARATPTATWRQVSVNHRECLGATKCPFAQECFAERAKEKAFRSHLIVTNHSLLAIDAVEGVPMIPDYDAVVIDEAHEVVARVTQAATDELGVADVERAARRSQRHVDDAGRPVGRGRRRAGGRRRRRVAGPVRRAARPAGRGARPGPRRRPRLRVGVPQGDRLQRARRGPHPGQGPGAGGLRDRRADGRGEPSPTSSGSARPRERLPPRLHVAPLQVWGQMRDKLLTDKTAVMTSATLMLGGDFSARRHLGRAQAGRAGDRRRARPSRATTPCRGAASTSGRRSTTASRRSSTSPATSRSPAATGWGEPSSTRSSSSSTRPRAARSGSSPRDGRPSARPRRSASGCRT